MRQALRPLYGSLLPEAGCDEAGRGCLAGPVTAAAVILPEKPDPILSKTLNDSKQLTAIKRQDLKGLIQEQALAYSVAHVDHHVIDKINILQASILAMHEALDKLSVTPACILADGKHFNVYKDIPHVCIIRGDGRYLSIAAASVLAKVERDELMAVLHQQYPEYTWDRNKGYPTPAHRNAILSHGLSPYHRKSFKTVMQQQLPL